MCDIVLFSISLYVCMYVCVRIVREGVNERSLNREGLIRDVVVQMINENCFLIE